MSASVSYQIIDQWPASDFGIILTVTYDTGSPFGVYHVDSSIFDQKPGGFTYTYTLSGEQSGVSLSTGQVAVPIVSDLISMISPKTAPSCII
ncbi:hypothetical protein [Vagococcus sp. WN89Y]|uniref:hypothetical protein n=1 Tax=Vagococcus sp. WN89Y TaxID=3457258 RepID=UPI003FCE2064